MGNRILGAVVFLLVWIITLLALYLAAKYLKEPETDNLNKETKSKNNRPTSEDEIIGETLSKFSKID